jgi:hypothetical protein
MRSTLRAGRMMCSICWGRTSFRGAPGVEAGGTERDRRRAARSVRDWGLDGDGFGAGGKTNEGGMGPPSMLTSLTIFLRRSAWSGAEGGGVEIKMLRERCSTSSESVDG